MATLSIDRLALSIPFMSEEQARRLAEGIANGLAATSLTWANGQFPSLRIDMTANAGSSADHLAEQVIAEVIRQIGRT